jgi:hypothetical protein
MYKINQLTTDPRQSQSIILPDGSSAFFEVKYSSMQYGWFVTTLKYNDFELHGVRLVNSPNILHQYRNQLNFGIGCFSQADREPTLIQDFSSGASNLYILTADEVTQFARFLSGEV